MFAILNSEEIENQSPHRLRRFVKLSRELGETYQSLFQRQNCGIQRSNSFKAIEIAKIFERLFVANEKRVKKMKIRNLG